MISEELGTQLHDRFTRGQLLSAEEMEQLQAWYAENDQEDLAQAKITEPTTDAAGPTQVDAVLAQIETATRRIRKLEKQNEALRRANTALQNDLLSKRTPQLV
jgi:endo-1,4-beta-D-glucanase Y